MASAAIALAVVNVGLFDRGGLRIDGTAVQLYRIENGQLAEHWEILDYWTIIRPLQGA
jgi:predicted SnoaL-like aldol condensation-catalyzing enzyme